MKLLTLETLWNGAIPGSHLTESKNCLLLKSIGTILFFASLAMTSLSNWMETCWLPSLSLISTPLSNCLIFPYNTLEAKWRHLKKFTSKGTLRQVFIGLRSPPLPGFCLGWSSNFVSSESGQIQIVKLLQNMVSNRTQHLQPLPNHTLSVYTVLWHREGGRGVESELERR
jgi:hypothetical protein